MNKIHGDAVDGRRRKRRRTTKRKETVTGTPDPMKLTGGSGFFMQVYSLWIDPGVVLVLDGTMRTKKNPFAQYKMTFYNDPLDDPNFLTMLSMQYSTAEIRRKYKRTSLELLKVRWHPRYAYTLSQLDLGAGTAQAMNQLFIWDGVGNYESIRDSSGTEKPSMWTIDNGALQPNTGTAQGLAPLRQNDNEILICQMQTLVGKHDRSGATSSAGNTTSGAFGTQIYQVEQDFTDGAGHGIILENNFITIAVVYRITADKVTPSASIGNPQWLQVYYRLHYQDLWEEEIKALQEKLHNRGYKSSTGSKTGTPILITSPLVESSYSESSEDSSEEEERMREKIKKSRETSIQNQEDVIGR